MQKDKTTIETKQFAASRNACKLCSPLGASMVFKGIEGCIPMIHGSQGCATYIRRYLISHYKEPMDIASSNFSEETTIYGGNRNFIQGIDNIRKQYAPLVMGIATTCLSETIGEDIPSLIGEYENLHTDDENMPIFIHASTPSYNGTHMDGFHEAVLSTIKTLAEEGKREHRVNILSGFISTVDIRMIKSIVEDFGLDYTLFPDYSKSMDNPCWKDYHLIPDGGTTINDLKKIGSSAATIEFGTILNKGSIADRIINKSNIVSGGEWLEKNMYIQNHQIIMPIGIEATDVFMDLLATISGVPVPEKYTLQRGRLIDAYIDGHKYVFGKRAIVYGEEDFVVGLSLFLAEIGIQPIIVASGGESGLLKKELLKRNNKAFADTMFLSGADFETIREVAKEMNPDIVIGNSKGYYIARELDIPIARVGFPIHDRVGGPRIKHLCYEGAQNLFDTIVNLLLDYKQEHSPVGYKYM